MFTKMHVSGNDFCLMNGLVGKLSAIPEAIRHLGDRRTGVGFDQLVLIERPTHSGCDVAVQFFNCDGTKISQCGNGCAAVAAFLHKHKLVGELTVRLETSQEITECTIVNAGEQDGYIVDVNLGSPRLDPKQVPFLTEEQQMQYELSVPSQINPIQLTVLSLGNPHAVVLVPDTDQVLLDALGAEIQQHESFPNSTNVEVLEVQSDSNGKLRIFERGVGETRACGTGAAAAMVAGRLLNKFSSAVNMAMPGGSVLVCWEGLDNPVIVQCAPTFVFTGTVPRPDFF